MEQAVASSSFERVVRQVVGVFCTVVWAIVGILYWIPLLARSCGAYSAAVIMAIISGKQANKKSARMLDHAANFYAKGFRDIRESVFDDSSTSEADDDTSQASIFSSWDEFTRVFVVVARESAIAIVFWLLIIFTIRHIF